MVVCFRWSSSSGQSLIMDRDCKCAPKNESRQKLRTIKTWAIDKFHGKNHNEKRPCKSHNHTIARHQHIRLRTVVVVVQWIRLHLEQHEQQAVSLLGASIHVQARPYDRRQGHSPPAEIRSFPEGADEDRGLLSMQLAITRRICPRRKTKGYEWPASHMCSAMFVACTTDSQPHY